MQRAEHILQPRPISRLRYFFGLAIFVGINLAIGAALHARALFQPRFRRVLPFYRRQFIATLGQVLRRERILIGPRASRK